MRILLTGGSGFIGRNILESSLSQQHVIFAPTRHELDLMSPEKVGEFFNSHQFDVVIHAAGKPGHRNATDKGNIFYNDVFMFLQLVKHEAKYQKLIVVGSGAIYATKNYHPRITEDESEFDIPAEEHAFYRYVAAQIAKGRKKIIELRVFGIFGKYEDYAIRFISNAICKTIFDLPITIKQNRRFDYVSMDDFIKILDHFIRTEPRERVFNVTPDLTLELETIAKIVQQTSGSNARINIAQNGLGQEYSGSNDRLKAEMGNLVFTPLEDSIKVLYDWYLANKHTIDRSKLLFDK